MLPASSELGKEGLLRPKSSVIATGIADHYLVTTITDSLYS